MSRRIFVGIPMTDEASRGLSKVVKKLQKKHWKVRYSPEDNWHVTVVFLGEVEEDERGKSVSSVKNVVEEVVHTLGPFELELKGLGYFPLPKKKVLKERVRGRIVHQERVWSSEVNPLPSVLFVRLGGDAAKLHELSRGIRDHLLGKGISFDEKPLWPHITLGRVEKRARAKEREVMGQEILKLWNMDIPQTLSVKRVNLYESVLSSQGARYNELARYVLGGI